MYRLNITKGQMGELVTMLLYDKLFNPEFAEESQVFNELIEALRTKGIKPKVHQFFFDTDPRFRARYRQFSKMLSKDRDVAINIWYDEDEQVVEEDIEQIIEICVKKLTKKENPNPEKLKKFINEVMLEVEDKGEE